MINPDKVIEECAAAAAAHATEVSEALADFVRYNEEAGARRRLRLALVAQAAGHESTSHDGATSEARREAARRALVAWDGADDQCVTLPVAGGVRCLISTAKALGFEVLEWTNAPATAREANLKHGNPTRALVIALSEGWTGEDAARRAVAINAEHVPQVNWDELKAREKIAEIEKAAAAMNLAAAREANKPR